MTINKGGYPTIFVVGITGVILAAGSYFLLPTVGYTIGGIFLALTLFVTFFFRDPNRNIPEDGNLILSPADGKVVLMQEIEENEYINGKATQISIFLSVMDVHVNRVPAGGKIEHAEYYPGKFHLAWDERASIENERAEFGLLHATGTKLFFKQITGFLARRIAYDLEVGQEVAAGNRFGIMKFGSRMDVIVPEGIEILVKKGDTTVAGESILARIPS